MANDREFERDSRPFFHRNAINKTKVKQTKRTNSKKTVANGFNNSKCLSVDHFIHDFPNNISMH